MSHLIEALELVTVPTWKLYVYGGIACLVVFGWLVALYLRDRDG